MTNETKRVKRILASLYRGGGLSKPSADALIKAKPSNIGTALGSESGASELLLVSVLVDDSISIAHDIEHIRFGYGKVLMALRTKSFDAAVQFHVRAMNKGVIEPYTDLAHAPALTEANYSGSDLAQVTPLYLQSVLLFGTAMLKAQEEADRGTRVRTYSLIITDGEDNRSGSVTVDDVRAMVTTMHTLWKNHVVAAMGVGERPETQFRDIFTKMGIPSDRQYTPGTSVERLQEDFDEIADMLAIAASSETHFAQLLPGSSA